MLPGPTQAVVRTRKHGTRKHGTCLGGTLNVERCTSHHLPLAALLQILGGFLVVAGAVLAGVANVMHIGGSAVAPWVSAPCRPVPWDSLRTCFARDGPNDAVLRSHHVWHTKAR